MVSAVLFLTSLALAVALVLVLALAVDLGPALPWP